jgi:hypothetical protein
LLLDTHLWTHWYLRLGTLHERNCLNGSRYDLGLWLCFDDKI